MTGARALALAIVVTAPLSAHADGALALADCLRLAEAAPSPVVVADRQRAIAAAHLQAARAGLLPRLSVTANYTRNSPLAGACCADDGNSFAVLTQTGHVRLLAPDLMPRWEVSLKQRAVAVAPSGMPPFTHRYDASPSASITSAGGCPALTSSADSAAGSSTR